MLADRSYMRNANANWKSWSFISWILVITAGFYILENLWIVLSHNSFILEALGIFPPALQSGYLWTLLTYALLHDPIAQGGIWHIVINSLVIFFTGKAVEEGLGFRRTAFLYGLSVLCGGIFWVLCHWNSQSFLVGASAGALGLMAYFCLKNANTPMTFLLFFIIPITMKPKWLLAIVTGIEALGFFFSELNGPYSIAHSAHLGGIAAAGLYFLYLERPSRIIPFPKTFPSSKDSPKISGQKMQVSLSSHQKIKEEVDIILDKINKRGFGALTQDEKEILNKAHDLLR
jgi:membrane associated rhomboid family serine protease